LLETAISTTNVKFNGVVSDGGRNMNVVLSGPGNFSFSQTALANTIGGGTTLDIRGVMADVDPSATVNLQKVPSTLVLVGSTAPGAFSPIGSPTYGSQGSKVPSREMGHEPAGWFCA
jgi:hypothetical protein